MVFQFGGLQRLPVRTDRDFYDALVSYFNFSVDGREPCRLPTHRSTVVLLDALLSTDDDSPHTLFFGHCDLSSGVEGQSHIGFRKWLNGSGAVH